MEILRADADGCQIEPVVVALIEAVKKDNRMEKQRSNDRDEFLSLLSQTPIMRQVEKSLHEEPAHILGAICSEHEKTGQPVPDYRLRLSGYVGEVSLKALLEAGLITQQSGGRVSIYTFSPTEAGLKQYQALKKSKAA